MRFRHTEQTAAIYNAMIKEYREISSDSDLESIGITYEEYRSSDFGFFLDCLRYDGIGTTTFENVANWAKRHGCTVEERDGGWVVSLQEVQA